MIGSRVVLILKYSDTHCLFLARKAQSQKQSSRNSRTLPSSAFLAKYFSFFHTQSKHWLPQKASCYFPTLV
jgi:hypothetical protein